MGDHFRGMSTMGDLMESMGRGEFFYEDSTTDKWKKGDKVPPGYRVVFGKLRKVGGETVAADAGGDAAGTEPQNGKAPIVKMSAGDAKAGAKYFDFAKHEPSIMKKLKGPKAEQAKKDISDTLRKVAGYLKNNLKELRRLYDLDDKGLVKAMAAPRGEIDRLETRWSGSSPQKDAGVTYDDIEDMYIEMHGRIFGEKD